MPAYRIATIPGDGIGVDTIAEAVATLKTVCAVHGGLQFEFEYYPWGCAYYLEHGKMMPDDGLKILGDYDAILFGAAGFPSVPDHISLWGLLLPIRQWFDQYINLRPVKLLAGIPGPLRSKGAQEIDFVCIRENTEGRVRWRRRPIAPRRGQRGGYPDVGLYPRRGGARVALRFRAGAQAAAPRDWSVPPSPTPCNTAWSSGTRCFARLQAEYPDIRCRQYHVDALAARFITAPETLDVVVASNLFGDILTDLGGALQGSLGIPPSGNINPERRYPSLFEPVHGSAPDIAGQGIANPIAAIWATSMMLDHLGHEEAGRLVLAAIESVTGEGRILTPDLGGRATTREVGEAIRAQVVRLGQ